MTTTLALTRAVSAALADCALTHLGRAPLDVELARRQHSAYLETLVALGCEVIRLDAAVDQPDCVFVEDTAVVLETMAIATRPGHAARAPEVAAVRPMLERWRPVRAIEAPGTLDGGDVLRVGRTLYVGASARTNAEGIRQLAALVEPLGYRVAPVPVTACLHLKTAVTAIGDDTLLLNPRWVDPAAFNGMKKFACDEREPFGGNALRVGDALVYAAEQPRTAEALARAGFDVRLVAFSELAKAEGGVTCCSVLIHV